MRGINNHNWLGTVGLSLLFSSGSWGQALLNPGGTGGAANSTPSTTSYEAINQETSLDMPTLGTSAPTNGAYAGIAAYVQSPVTADNNTTSLGLEYSSPENAPKGGNVVYDTNGTTGTNTSNPLGLGTASATPNTFSVASGSTINYSVDIQKTASAYFYLGLFNPKATDAGSASTDTFSSGGYLGIALQLEYFGTVYSQFNEEKKFDLTSNAALGTQQSIAATSNLRAVIALTNNGDGTDTASATLYTLSSGIGTTPTFLQSITPVTFTLGTAAGDIDLSNSGVGVEVGETIVSSTGSQNYVGNISLTTTPEPATGLTALAFLSSFLLRPRRNSSKKDAACQP